MISGLVSPCASQSTVLASASQIGIQDGQNASLTVTLEIGNSKLSQATGVQPD